jgi:hypothetical protein
MARSSPERGVNPQQGQAKGAEGDRRRTAIMRRVSAVVDRTGQEAYDFLDAQNMVGLIRFGGHLSKGEYDVDHGGHEG